jgi:hypothetical protein
LITLTIARLVIRFIVSLHLHCIESNFGEVRDRSSNPGVVCSQLDPTTQTGSPDTQIRQIRRHMHCLPLLAGPGIVMDLLIQMQ